MTFEDLDLIEPIRKALVQEGYTTPTPIQSEAIPIVSQGYDLLGCAQTGTGKTAAFSIPIIQRLYLQKKKGYKRGIKALILTPTRELAIQIGESFAAYGRFAGLRHTVIFGGVGQKPQTEALERGIDILIATPGRLLDLIGQGFIHLDTLEYFVLDEADRMLDMGFIHDIKRILPLLPKKRQSLFFSATMPPEIERLAGTILSEPQKVEVTPASSTVDAIDQSVYFVEKAEKINLLKSLFGEPGTGIRIDLYPYETRGGQGGPCLVESGDRGGGDPWQQEPDCPPACLDEFQGSYDPCADRYGYRRPWNRRGSSDTRH